jgi:hypothetical protein
MSVDFLVKLRDAHQMAADALNEEIEKRAPAEVKHDAKDFDKLAWTEKTGQKGIYQQTTKEANNNSELFRDLQKIIKDHKGFYQLGGFKLWFDRSNEDVIDRRAK